MCASFWFCVFYYQLHIANYMDKVLDFWLILDKYQYTNGIFWSAILSSIFIFFLKDLIDRINSYSHRIDFQSNLLLIGFQHSAWKVFSNENKQPSLEWRCVHLLGEIMAENCWWVLKVVISILFKGDSLMSELSESIKKGKFVTKIFFHIMLNEVLKICGKWYILM